jgi:hypothetical protein
MNNLSANSNKTHDELTSTSVSVHSMEGLELSKAPDELPAIERLALDSPATSEQASKANPDGSSENAAPSLVDKSSSVESQDNDERKSLGVKVNATAHISILGCSWETGQKTAMVQCLCQWNG